MQFTSAYQWSDVLRLKKRNQNISQIMDRYNEPWKKRQAEIRSDIDAKKNNMKMELDHAFGEHFAIGL